MITYGQLWAAEPAAWRRAGAAWRSAVGTVERRAAELAATSETLRSGWSGTAGRAAGRRLADLGTDLTASRPVFVEIDQLLTEYAARLAQAKAMLHAAVTVAADAGVLVDRGGGVSLDPAASGPAGRAAGQVREVVATIHGALELAATADRETARRLSELTADASTGWVRPPPAGPPPSGTDPVAVRRWWDALTPAHRRWLVAYEPALVGRVDGVPAAARDQANQLLLEAYRASLLARRVQLRGTRPRTPCVLRELTRVDGTLTGLDAVAGRLVADTAPRAYLLSLDPAGDGRAILAIGNPDHADNVLTYVPGMSSCLPAIEAELGRADRMAARCAELGPTEQTATVLWLDYDAPDFLDEAMRSTQAEAAGPALHRFQEGLRASHDAAPAYQTVLGHSYGSLVVGAAARDHGLAADSLVFVGSPGVGVDHAADLTTPDVRIWSTTARDDPIQYGALGRGEVLGRLATAVALPLVGFPLAFGRPGRELWFGRNPSDAGFGARIFSGDARGHMGYWETGNPALDGMARIALGTAG